MVCVFALAMAICSKGIAATQFAIYMSIMNLGASAGPKAFGLVSERTSYVQNYVVLGLFVVAMLFSILFHRDATAQEGGGVVAPDLPGQ
jgi:PAT family beta-lactamase induction signal transducer AmpG